MMGWKLRRGVLQVRLLYKRAPPPDGAAALILRASTVLAPLCAIHLHCGLQFGEMVQPANGTAPLLPRPALQVGSSLRSWSETLTQELVCLIGACQAVQSSAEQQPSMPSTRQVLG